MKFEVGKCYVHINGLKMRILAEVDTCFYGHCFVSEDNYGRIAPIGTEEEATANWTECQDFLPDPEKGETIEEVVMPAAAEIDISDMNPDVVAEKPDDVVLEETENAPEAEENVNSTAEEQPESEGEDNETD